MASPHHPDHETVAQHARALWQERGCPEGRDKEIWLEAERRLSEGRAGAPEAASAASVPEPALTEGPAPDPAGSAQAARRSKPTSGSRPPMGANRRATGARPKSPEPGRGSGL